jgi:hypothetical protein
MRRLIPQAPSAAASAASTSNDTSSSSTSHHSNPQEFDHLQRTMEREFFIVQRCWHSGPQQHQPLDYLRLFDARSDAEEAAYHSAHAWSRKQSPQDPSVKTLLLPSSPQQQQQNRGSTTSSGASYGFIANGSMFWIRSIYVSITDHTNEQAYAVVTEGVIGGTGNRMSRRGTEVCRGRVFVGGSNARFLALQASDIVVQTIPGCTSYVATLPVGKPSEYATGRFLQEWPAEIPIHNDIHTSSSMNVMDTENNAPNKRDSNHWSCSSMPKQQQQQHGGYNEPALFLPVAKRRRMVERPFWQVEGAQPGAEDEMVMS